MFISLSVRFFGKPQVSLILLQCHVLPNIVICTHFRISFCCFAFPSCPQVPLHPSASICTHLHPFLPLFHYPPKTSCPGKFPRPQDPIPVLRDPKCPLLVLFLCPPVPLHPTTPIHTYPHPYIFIFSPLHPVYMCYTCKFKLKNTNLNHLNIKFQTYYQVQAVRDTKVHVIS